MWRQGGIRDSKNKNYWDLTSGEFQLASTATIGGKTAATIAQDAVDAQTQRTIFNKLTNGGQTQGIYLSNGLLYINATYLKTGIISDNAGRNTWNLTTGSLTTNYMTANNVTASGSFTCGSTYQTKLTSSGALEGYRNNSKVAQIDYTSALRNISTNQTTYGIQIVGNGHIRLVSPSISVLASSNTGATSTTAKSGTFSYVSSIRSTGNGGVAWTTRQMKFINGILVNA